MFETCHFAPGMVGSSVDAKLTKILELLEAKAIEQYRFSEAKAGKSRAVGIAMVQLDLVSTSPGTLPSRWPRGYRSYSFTAYQWPLEVDEERESPKLQEHFEREVAKLGVLLGEGGYQVLDVRGQDRLSFQCCSATTTLAFNGGTDAVVTPFGEKSWELQLCELIDWKSPLSLSVEGHSSMGLEQRLELFGALYHSNRPPIVIFTDLNNFVIYQPYGKAIRYFHTLRARAAGRISTSDAMRLIAYHLTEVSPKEPGFHFQQLESVPKKSELAQLAAPLLAAKVRAGAGQG